MSRTALISATAAVAALLFAFPILPSHAESKLDLTFETHAAFFSKETKQPTAIDPQVFVMDPAAKAATGPQNIAHAAKFRPAVTSSDPLTKLYNAKGEPLGLRLGSWLGARGTVSISPAKNGAAEISARFTGLQPNGVYSLFENHFDQKPIGFTPLDGQGRVNSFRADAKGSGQIAVTAPKMLTSANAILLVYHSDGQTHGQSRGEIGINAHHQLIAKIP